MNISILLVVKKPDAHEQQARQKYDHIVEVLAGISRRNKDIRLLAENTMLLPLNAGLQDVVAVVNAFGGLSYTYTIFHEDIEWHEVANDQSNNDFET